LVQLAGSMEPSGLPQRSRRASCRRKKWVNKNHCRALNMIPAKKGSRIWHGIGANGRLRVTRIDSHGAGKPVASGTAKRIAQQLGFSTTAKPMMEPMITVNLAGELLSRFGKRSFQVPWKDGMTIAGLLKELATRQDPWFGKLLHNQNDPEYGPILVLYDGRSLHLPEDGDQQLAPGDLLFLLPPILGG